MVIGLLGIQADALVGMQNLDRRGVLLIIITVFVSLEVHTKIRITLLRLLNGAAKDVSVDGIDELQLQPDGIVHADGKASHYVHDVAGGYGILHAIVSFRIAVRLCDCQDI